MDTEPLAKDFAEGTQTIGVTFLEVGIELLIPSFGTDSDTVSSSSLIQYNFPKTSTAE